MKKSELKSGHIITLSNGMEMVVFLGYPRWYGDRLASNDLIIAKDGSWYTDLERFDNNLDYIEDGCFDTIDKVSRASSPYSTIVNAVQSHDILLWERTKSAKASLDGLI